MHVKYLAGIVGAALLMAGCSSSNELSAAGQSVRIVDEQPGAECQLIGTATGKQSNWLSGQHGVLSLQCRENRPVFSACSPHAVSGLGF